MNLSWSIVEAKYYVAWLESFKKAIVEGEVTAALKKPSRLKGNSKKQRLCLIYKNLRP